MDDDGSQEQRRIRVDKIRLASNGVAWGQRPHFAQMHLESAAFQARRSYTLEQDLPGGLEYETHYYRDVERDERYIEHRACVTGAIFSAVAAVDAAVSAPYVDAAEKSFSSRTPIEQGLAAVWDIVRGQPMPRRIDAALHLFDQKSSALASWQNINHVLQFRNSLTHFIGGTVWTHSDIADTRPLSEPTDLEKLLKSKGFAPNRFGLDRVFPLTYLSYGCAAWVVNSSREFIDEVYDRMNKRSPFVQAEEYLRTRNRLSPFSPKPLTLVSD